MIKEEKKKDPPFEEEAPAPSPAPAAAAVDSSGTTPTTTTPRPLLWTDFPNSQDTTWSERHPECPQGPPCFCNCKCHGAPPQNFVEPPPPPPSPCPLPPPTPDPSRLSVPFGAPPAV